MEDDFDINAFHFITCNFPPNPAPVTNVNGHVVCDLTTYDPPTDFPSNILSNQNLEILKIFTDNLSSVPDEVGNLKKLKQLVLGHFESHIHENVTKLPLSLKNLRQLELLDLRNNPLSTFPSQLTTVVHLQELHVNNCNLSCLPDQLDHLQQLSVLDLSNNSFTTLPLCVTKLQNLVTLYMSDAKLETLCKEIKNLVKLERLQLTNNQLKTLPDELFELVNLKKLHMNINQLSSLDDKVGDLVNLEYLVLDRNKLTKLPHTIGNLKKLHYLNLYENKLTRLPESVTSLTKVETLLVEKNPLQVPPVHVCNQGIPSISNYFQAMKNTGNIHSKRLKVVLVGESLAGKTSLVNALVEGEAVEINTDDRTFGVVFYHWKPEPDVDELELLVVDCAGQREYQMTHQLFLSKGALFLLTVNLSSYDFDNQECFRTTVGDWITFASVRIPQARILVVPTHIDECVSQEEIDLKCKNILTNIKEQQNDMIEKIERKIKYIRKTEGSCIPEEDLKRLLEQHRMKRHNLPIVSLQYQKEAFRETQNPGNNLSMNVLPVSNVGSLQGMISLRKELVRIARNKTLSPTVDAELPESWVKLEITMKELRKNIDVPCVSVAEFVELLKQNNSDLPRAELESCLTYLNAIGEMAYFKDISGLERNVVLNPNWLGSVLTKIFRHDLAETLQYKDGYRKLDLHHFQFNQDKQMLLTRGIMSQPLLKCIWSDLIETSDDIFSQLLTMFTHFGLVCELPSPAIDLTNGTPTVCYLVPWFLSSKRPDTLSTNWPPIADNTQSEIAVGFGLLQYLPYGVFERFSVRCHGHEPEDFDHWHNGLYMKFGDVLVLGSCSCSHGCATLTLTARGPTLPDLWKILLNLLKEVQKLLLEWPGMNYVCFTVCPECVRLGVKEPYRFTCNWLNACKINKKKAMCCNKVKGTSHTVDLNHLFPSNEVLSKHQNPENPTSVSLQDGILPDEMVDDIAEELGRKWPQLARKLGIGKKVDSIMGDHRDETHEQAVAMLNKWKMENGENAKISILIKALRDLKFNEIADFVRNKFNSIKRSEEGNPGPSL